MEGAVYPEQSNQPRQRIIDTVKEYGTRLFRFIRRKVNSDEDAEDILQDVCFQLADVTHPETIETMTRNKIIDKHRKKKTGIQSQGSIRVRFRALPYPSPPSAPTFSTEPIAIWLR
jgi:DNA-directed RNA polymerase specialized sigma24 family protein